MDDLPAPFISTQNAAAQVLLAATLPPAPSGWPALSPTLYRLATQLRALADGRGVLWLAEAEAAEVFGTAIHGTQRNQLSSLKRAGVLIYAFEVGWFVRFVVQDYTNSVQERTNFVQNRTMGEDGNRAESHDDGNGRAGLHDFRAESHDDENGIVQDYTNSVQERTNFVQNRTIPTTTNKAVCLLDPDLDPTGSKQTNKAPEPEPPFVPDPTEAHTAKRLLTDIGVIPVTADLIVARRSLFDVRRVVGYWAAHRQAVGGTLLDTPNFVVSSLNNLADARVPAGISRNFLHSELHRSHLTPAELAEYAVTEEEPEPAPLVRVRDEDAQVEPDAGAPTGFDPARTWLEFAAGHDGLRGTRLTSYDPETGAATVSAPAAELGYLKSRGAIIARKHTPALFGRPVFVTFVEVQP